MSRVFRIHLQTRYSKVGLVTVMSGVPASFCSSSVRGIISRCVRPGDWIRFRLMCRERGSVIFYPRAVFDELIGQAEPEGLFMEVDKQPYAHLLSASENVILNEIIEREKLELLKQLEEDGDQPEACFIRQALEENNVNHMRSVVIDTHGVRLGTG